MIQDNKGDVKGNKIKSRSNSAKVRDLLPALLEALQSDSNNLADDKRLEADALAKEIQQGVSAEAPVGKNKALLRHARREESYR